jgi:hypothetical protein
VTADLLFAFDDESDVAWQFGAGFQIRFNSFEVRKVLTFVIAGATCKKGRAFDARLERRSFPKVKWFRRLDVIMAVNEEMRPSALDSRLSILWTFCDHNRMAFRRAKPRIEPDFAAMIYDPLGAGMEILLMFRLSGNAGESNIFAELFDRALLVLFEVFENVGEHETD